MEFVTNIATTPTETVMYENLVAMCAREAMVAEGIESNGSAPVVLKVDFQFAISPTRQRKLKDGSLAKGSLAPGMPHTQKPDLDNCLKSIKDGCTQGGVWNDDCCVCEVLSRKIWSDRACAVVTVETL
jgi:Holliday junction resolvase RusA-like endonuclease